MFMIRVGIRYILNNISRVAEQQGVVSAILVGARLIVQEFIHFIRYPIYLVQTRHILSNVDSQPAIPSSQFISELKKLDVNFEHYEIDIKGFQSHIERFDYPGNYAAGPMNEGGSREQKILEYYVSVELLKIRSEDIVIDIASEWSIFPEMVKKLYGATIYRQDLIFPPGVHGEQIGGSAAHMPIPDEFADKLVLHNAFEHFEGIADSNFILEAWRVLKPKGYLCILPLFLTENAQILTDPLVNRRGVIWDKDTQIVEIPWWHNRFGRYYSLETFQNRILYIGHLFRITIFHVRNSRQVHPRSYMDFALVMQKP